MQIEKNLEKLNIYPKEKLNLEEKIHIARNVSEMLCENIEELSESYNSINMRLLNCDMYYADIDEKFGKVIYYYKNNAIYLSANIDEINQEQLLHECIHYLQNFTTVMQSKQRAGLTNFEEFKIIGLGINEAITAYIAAMAMEKRPTRIEDEKISIVTNSNTYYKYMTSLIHQIVFLMGKKEAILSAMNSDDEFEENLYNTFEENTDKILKNFDILLDENNNENKDEEKIIDLYLQTQELVYKTYFKKTCKLVTTKDEVDEIVQKVFDYEKIVGRVLENSGENNGIIVENAINSRLQYNKNFDDFINEMDDKFYKKYIEIDRKIVKNLPVVKKKSFINKIIDKIKKCIKGKQRKNLNN